jgi:hypothetical protein
MFKYSFLGLHWLLFMCSVFTFSLYFVLMSFELRILHLLGTKALYHWRHAPNHFALVIFQVGSHFFLAQARLDHSPAYCFFIAGVTNMPPCPAFYWLRWCLTVFLPGLSSNHHPPNLCFLQS